MKKEMISVVVPVYNIKAYIKRCIQSILEQTYPYFELLLIDDGSTDGSGDICDCYAGRDKRIQVIHKENGGLSDARNTGTRQAKGEWITYIDGDDYVEPCYLEELYRAACEGKASVSVIQSCVQHGEQKKKRQIQVLSGREAAKEIVCHNSTNMIVAWGKLYHKELFPLLVYPKGKIQEDEFITYRVLYKAERVAVSSKVCYNYVVRKGSITQKAYDERRLDKLEALREAVLFFKEKKDEEMMAYAKLRYFLNLQIAWYRVKKSSVIKEKKRLLTDLKEKRQHLWEKEGKLILRTARPIEKITIYAFSFSPKLYGVICTAVLAFSKILSLVR